jgi:hypothetical protein
LDQGEDWFHPDPPTNDAEKNISTLSITTISTNTNTYALPKPTINQPSKEDRTQQVQNLAKEQRKINNNKQTRR